MTSSSAPGNAPAVGSAPETASSSGVRRANIEVLIPTFNEEINIVHALHSTVPWADRVWLIDSESTDRTREIAESMGANVLIQPWLGYAKQKNFALANIAWESDWVFILDADETITPALRDELLEIASRPASSVKEAGFYVNRLTYFMGRPIRHCGYYPSYNLRFFKHGRAWYEDRDVHEHMVVDGPSGRVKHIMTHEDRRGLEHFIAKHNRYSTLEAREIVRDRQRSRSSQAQELERGIALRRWLKRHVQPRLPFPGLWRFVYMYFVRLGFLDGLTGLRFCLLLATYDFFISLKMVELKRTGAVHDPSLLGREAAKGLAVSEGELKPGRKASSKFEETESRVGEQLGQMAPESSPWTLREKIARALWMLIGRPVFRASFHNWYGFRAWLLRRFGAQVGQNVRIRPSVYIEIPWHLRIADDVTIGDYAILYSLGYITIGARTIVSQYAHLCAGTHDYTKRRFPLLREPIEIGEDAWVCADTFVGPSVKIGRLSVLGARSSAFKSLDPGMVYAGNPARKIKQRELS